MAAGPDGEALYKLRCAKCHDQPEERVPSKDTLSKRAPEEIVKALMNGPMKAFAEGWNADDLRAVATHLAGKMPTATIATAEPNLCSGAAPRFSLDGPQWLGWGRDLDNSRFQPNPGIKPEDVPKLKVKWAFGYQGNITYGQPTIAGGRVFVTTAGGKVLSLDAKSGCTYWSIDAGSGVRTAISIGPLPRGGAARYAAYFGDEKTFVHAVDAETGKPLWKTQLDQHPLARVAGAPILNQDRLFVPLSSWEEGAGRDAKYECCKFQGAMASLDANTGKLIWMTRTMSDPPKPFKKNSAGTQMYGPAGAAIWSAPTLDLKRKAIYAGTGNSYTDVGQKTANAILAFDMETGSLRWSNQVTPADNFLVGCMAPGVGNCPSPVGPDVDFGTSPILRTLKNGKQVLLAGQKSGIIYALDPDQRGKVLWQQQAGEGSALGGIEWGPAADGDQVYVAISDVLPKKGKLPGGISAFKIETGERVWHTPAPKPVCSWGNRGCSPAQSAAVTVIPGVVFSGSLDGHLRGYSVKDGSIVWDFDTGVEFPTVNGVKAKGGSIDAAGPTVAGGMLFINSGYGRFVGQGGNVLLALTVDGK
jgi:polyvinyl alcohol dehydrogenase (cytochrome)